MKYLGFLLLLWSASALAQLDSASETGVVQTQQLLKSPTERQKYIDDHANAKAADSKAEETAGSKENKDKMYDIASGITRELAEKNGGDAKKMNEVLEKAATDPEGFYKSLSPEMRAQIHDLSGKIETEKPPGPSQP